MRPLVLAIPGRFWDSQIYSGRLYVFGLDGRLSAFDWDSLIQSWPVPEPLRLPLTCAFLRSDFLYGSDLRLLFRDPEVLALMQRKFSELAEQALEPSRQALTGAFVGEQDSPFPFPHVDTEIYDSKLYACGPSGISRTGCNKQTKYPVSTRPTRFFDGPSTAIAASGGRLAVAAGEDGLFVLSVDGYDFLDTRRDPHPIAARHCHDCSWVYYSIYACSTVAHGFLAEYSRFRNHVYVREAPPRFTGIRDSLEIFESEGFSWGVQDKICLARNGAIEIARYTPWSPEPTDRVVRIGNTPSVAEHGEVVSASAAPFGLVVEYSTALVVYPSVGEPVVLDGEPVAWRVFPRSKHYENHLHVIREDALYVYSFNDDYLVDQDKKLLGTKVIRSLTLRDRRLLALIEKHDAA